MCDVGGRCKLCTVILSFAARNFVVVVVVVVLVVATIIAGGFHATPLVSDLLVTYFHAMSIL